MKFFIQKQKEKAEANVKQLKESGYHAYIKVTKGNATKKESKLFVTHNKKTGRIEKKYRKVAIEWDMTYDVHGEIKHIRNVGAKPEVISMDDVEEKEVINLL
jgi:hypothetical protein